MQSPGSLAAPRSTVSAAMRVLHVIDVVSPVGGAQTYLHGVAKMQLAARHEVAVVHADRDGSVPQGVLSKQLQSAATDEWVTRFDPDVVHVHGPTLPRELEHLRSSFPLVHGLHDFGFACASGSKYFRSGSECRRSHGPGCLTLGPAQGCPHRLDPRPLFTQYRRIEVDLPKLRRGAAVVAHSRYVADVAVANGIPVSSLTTVPHGVQRSPEPPPLSDARTAVFAGRIVPDKGLDVLIDALARIGGLWDELVVIGDGWDVGRCRRLAAKRGVDARVTFLGHRPAAEVRAAMVRARVVVVPSRWPEPFGLVGLEAMAEARPVVASRTGGIPEWLDHGATGLLVEPGDPDGLARAVAQMLERPETAAAMGIEGWRRVARFSPEAHLARLDAVYERAVLAYVKASDPPYVAVS